MAFEKQRWVLHHASISWLGDRTFEGETVGAFHADYDGGIAVATA
jgi:hypothetical protein